MISYHINIRIFVYIDIYNLKQALLEAEAKRSTDNRSRISFFTVHAFFAPTNRNVEHTFLGRKKQPQFYTNILSGS